MSLHYSHLLVAADPRLRPTPQQIARFLGGILELGVVPNPKIDFWPLVRVKPAVRQVKIPSTGQIIEVRSSSFRRGKSTEITDTKEFEGLAEGVAEFDICASGQGLPRVPPLPIDFAEEYCLAVTCRIRTSLISMSDLHEEAESSRKPIPFGDECDESDSLGVFTHPHTLEVIEVPGAGCARFWIEFELGKFLFPELADGDTAILHPAVVGLASENFGVEFIQGFMWG